MDPIQCPICKEGVMKLQPATKPLGSGYVDKGGAKLVCTTCGHQALPSELRKSKNSH
jgi:hypothetical protein